jgi:hypothetical protein
VIRKQAAGGDTFTWTSAAARKWAGVLLCIQNGTWDTTTPLDVENGTVQGTTASTTYTTPTVTPTVDNCLLVACFGNNVAGTWTCTNTGPVMLEAGDTAASGSGPASAAMYHSALNAFDLIGVSRVATGGSSANGGMWIATVRPSATAPGYGKWQGQPPGTKRQRAQQRAANW